MTAVIPLCDECCEKDPEMKSQLPMIDYETASDEVKAVWDEEVAKRGRMTNMKRTFMHSLPAFRIYMEFYTLYDRLLPVLGKQKLYLFCHAISTGNDCIICSMYFRRNLIDSGINPDTYEPSEDEQVFIDFGRSFSHANPTHRPDPAIFPKLKARLTNEQMVDLVCFGGLMVASNMFNDFLGVNLDEALYDYLPDGKQPE